MTRFDQVLFFPVKFKHFRYFRRKQKGHTDTWQADMMRNDLVVAVPNVMHDEVECVGLFGRATVF